MLERGGWGRTDQAPVCAMAGTGDKLSLTLHSWYTEVKSSASHLVANVLALQASRYQCTLVLIPEVPLSIQLPAGALGKQLRTT